MTVRILSEHDVYRLLPVADCIEPMERVLAALAREELYNPLRFVVRPPEAETLMGLMPAYRSGEGSVYALKTVCVVPGNAARGLDSHQGFVALFDGETGVTLALVNAGAITAIRTAAVTAVATRLLARPDSRTLAILGSGTQGRSHLEAMRAVLPFEEVRAWSRTPGNAAKLDGVVEVATAEEAVRGADVVVTVTAAREPVVQREWLSRGSARERRRIEHPDDPGARHRHDGRCRALRRPPRVDPERGRRLPLSDARGRNRPRAHPGRDRRAPDRLGAGTQLRRAS